MQPWWVIDPEQLEAEEEGLKRLGLGYHVDETAKQCGLLRIVVDVPYEDESLQLEALYPATYPYFPPHVRLLGHRLERHQNPVDHQLCLLARGGEDWKPGHDTLAVLIHEQLPKILKINQAEDVPEYAVAHEDHVGEPFASFLPYEQQCGVIVPDETPAPEIRGGKFTVRTRPKPDGWPRNVFVNGILETVCDFEQRPLIEFRVTVPVFSRGFNGYWLRLAERPAREFVVNPNHFVQLMMTEVPTFKRLLDKTRHGQVFLLGFVYRDEVSWRESADDWFFVAAEVVKKGKMVSIESKFIRADWGGESAWMQRAPSLRPLRFKSALLIGLGSLGSPLALQLARAGIKNLHILDFDYLQVGNTVRWALGWQYAGIQKGDALAAHLRSEYPYTAVHVHGLRFGDLSHPANDYEYVRTLFENVDLVIDAAASYRVSHFLADLSQELQKPYVWLTTTHGTAGGVVGRVLPGNAAGCWHCFQRRLADHSIRLPAAEEGAEIQPGGCSQATFIGAGINSDEVALLAARMAVATLCRGKEAGYPDFNWNVAVGDLTRNGVSLAPEWNTYPLDTHPDCDACKEQ